MPFSSARKLALLSLATCRDGPADSLGGVTTVCQAPVSQQPLQGLTLARFPPARASFCCFWALLTALNSLTTPLVATFMRAFSLASAAGSWPFLSTACSQYLSITGLEHHSRVHDMHK